MMRPKINSIMRYTFIKRWLILTSLFIIGGMPYLLQAQTYDIKFKNISNLSQKSLLTASVCTGSSLIGKAGLLEGKMATTHWRTFGFLGSAAPNAKIKRNVLFTVDQKICTSAGVTSGIALALHLVSYFFGLDVGMATAKFMEFPYPTHNVNPFHDDLTR